MVNENKQHGFSTVEILIATSILVIVFSAVILLVLGSQKLSTDTRVAHAGQLLNEKMLEEGRSAAAVDFNSNQTYNSTVNSGSLTYTLSRSQSYISPCVKRITARVDWTLEGNAQYVTSATQVTNPAMVLQAGAECATEPPSGGSQWRSCYEYSSADLPSSNYDAYDVAVARIGGNKYLFMVGHPSSQNHPEDLWVYNINDVANPSFVSKLDANADNQVGLNSIVVAKNNVNGKHYAYMTSDDNKNQLVIVDVSAPATLGAATIRTISGFGNGVKPKDIEYFNNKIFLAIGSTIQVFDVTTPTSPTGPTAISLNGTANNLAVNNNYLFVADSDNAGELSRISLSNYNLQTKFDASGNEDGTAIFVTGGTAYLGRTQNANDLQVLDISGVTISSLGTKNMNHQNNSDVVDVVVSGPFAFVASTSANKELQVYDISDPTNIIQRCDLQGVNPTNIGFGMGVFENYVYMAMRANSELAVFADHQ